LPKSSVSDFELFALKVEENIAAKVKKSEEDSAAYRLQKEEEALQKTEKWFTQKRAEWELELKAWEQQERRAIEDNISQKWSHFRKESERVVKETLKKRLKEEFPMLAECFIVSISKQYQAGIFIVPEVYSELVHTERFDLEICQEEILIFKQGNLYIEYSIERIMEEFKGEMTAMMRFTEDSWRT